MKGTRRGNRKNNNRRQNGGGAGGGWGFSPEAVGTLINNPLAYKEIGNCRAETARPGFITNGYDSLRVHGGLPGMKGGKRSKSRKQNKKSKKSNKGKQNQSRKVQSGGRYGFDPQLAPLIGGTPSTSGYAPITHIPCEASRSIIPDSGAAGILNSRSSYLWDPASSSSSKAQGGGGIGGVAASGAPFAEIPRAYYGDNLDQPIRSAAGTNIMVHTPFNYSHMNQACLKTGGGKKRTNKKSKKSKKSNKSKKTKKTKKSKKSKSNNKH